MGVTKLINFKNSTLQPSLNDYFFRRLHPKTSFDPSDKKQKNTIEGTPLLSFSASMTVEAALALPIFLFFFLNLLWVIEIFGLYGTLLTALRETGHEMSVYAYAYDSIVSPADDSGLEALVENVAFSYLYVKSKVEDLAGEAYLERSPLTYGKKGLFYALSSILQEDDKIDLVIIYRVSPLLSQVGFSPTLLYTRYYGRTWTGYAVEDSQGTAEYAYVTENGEVYHLDRNCTHIRLSIAECDAGEVGNLRNLDGDRYLPCELCITDGRGRLYITERGDRYHQLLDCSGLKRTVRTILLSEAQNRYPMCSRCGR